MTRDEAIKRLHKYAEYAYGIWHDGDADIEAIDMAIEALQAEPKTGEWITDKDGYPHCSECGFSYGCIECCHDEDTYFCPNCGSKMDKE